MFDYLLVLIVSNIRYNYKENSYKIYNIRIYCYICMIQVTRYDYTMFKKEIVTKYIKCFF